jgi:hypothetical protein
VAVCCRGHCWRWAAWPDLAANVAVAEPTATGRVIAAWPSFALIAAYELLMRQVRRSSAVGDRGQLSKPGPKTSREDPRGNVQCPPPHSSRPSQGSKRPGNRGRYEP